MREGVALRRQQRDSDALATFERAWTARPTPMVRAQIALAEQALGRWRAADAHLREALDASDAWIDRNRAMLTDALRAIDERLGTLEVIGPPDGATLAIDGEVVATFPLHAPVRWTSGAATVTVQCEGHRAVERSVTFEPGVLLRESITLRPLPPPEPAPVAPTTVTTPVAPGVPPPVLRVTRPRRPSRGAGAGPWVLGAAGLGVSAIGMVASLVIRGDALASLHGLGCFEADGALTCPSAAGDTARTLHARGEAASIGVDVSIAVGLSALAGAALWWAFGGRAHRASAPSAVVCGGASCAVAVSF